MPRDNKVLAWHAISDPSTGISFILQKNYLKDWVKNSSFNHCNITLFLMPFTSESFESPCMCSALHNNENTDLLVLLGISESTTPPCGDGASRSKIKSSIWAFQLDLRMTTNVFKKRYTPLYVYALLTPFLLPICSLMVTSLCSLRHRIKEMDIAVIIAQEGSLSSSEITLQTDGRHWCKIYYICRATGPPKSLFLFFFNIVKM